MAWWYKTVTGSVQSVWQPNKPEPVRKVHHFLPRVSHEIPISKAGARRPRMTLHLKRHCLSIKLRHSIDGIEQCQTVSEKQRLNTALTKRQYLLIASYRCSSTAQRWQLFYGVWPTRGAIATASERRTPSPDVNEAWSRQPPLVDTIDIDDLCQHCRRVRRDMRELVTVNWQSLAKNVIYMRNRVLIIQQLFV